MTKIFKVIGIVAAALLLIGAALLFALFRTPPGQSLLKAQIEQRAGDALGGDVTIGRLRGALPNEVRLEKVTLNDDTGAWATVDEAELRWRVFALLGGDIVVDSLTVNGGSLTGLPKGDPAATTTAPKAVGLPDTLPSVHLKQLVVSNFLIGGDLLEAPTDINLAGEMKIGGRDIKASADLQSSNGADELAILVDRNPSTDNLRIDVRLSANEGGVISTLAKLPEGISLEIDGDGLVTDYALNIAVDAKSLGGATGVLAGDLFSRENLRFEIAATPGAQLGAITEALGDTINAAFVFTDIGDGIDISSLAIDSPKMALTGAAKWRNSAKRIDAAEATIKLSTLEQAPPEFWSLMGEAATVAVSIKKANDNYDLTGSVRGDNATIEIENGATDFTTFVATDIALVARHDDVASGYLRDGLNMNARVDLRSKDQLSFSDAALTLGDYLDLTGGGEVSLENETLVANGVALISPGFFDLVESDIAASGDIRTTFALSGSVDDARLVVSGRAPALTMADKNIPATTFEADLKGLPQNPQGVLNAKGVGGNLALNGRLTPRSNSDVYDASLRYTDTLFALDVVGYFNRTLDRINGAVTYTGRQDAEPWPGISLAGDLKADVSLAPGATDSKILVTSNNLAVNDARLSALDFSATGAPKNLKFELSAMSITPNTGVELRNTTAAGVIDLSEGANIAVSQLATAYKGLPVKSRNGFKVALQDGASIKGLDLAVGPNGFVKIDAAFSSMRWTAAIEARDVPFPEAAASFGLSADLDTDNKTPASGDFKLQSLLTNEALNEINGRFVWDGRNLNLVEAGDNSSLELDITAPLTLRRTPAIGVSLDGAVTGTAAYDGRLETLAGFLPGVLQSLEGDLVMRVDLAGTTENPAINGSLTVSNAAYTEFSTGLTVRNIDATATAGSRVDGAFIDFKADATGDRDEEKSIFLEGRAEAGENANIRAKLQLNKAKFSAAPVTSVVSSGELTLTGSPQDMRVSGDILVEELNAEAAPPVNTGLVPVKIVAVGENGEPMRDDEPEVIAPPVKLDIKITAPDEIFVRGRGLESEWRADMTISGDLAEPVLLGRLASRRGYIDFAGRRFTLEDSSIAFDRLSRNNPSLDIEAAFSTADVNALIEIGGRGQSPSVNLSSTPSLPQSDIMALVLFGKPSSDLSATESLQVAQALAQLGGVGPFGGGGITGSAREALGLDLLNIDLDSETSASSLTVGKYVTDGLFISGTQNARGDEGSVRVEYEITDNISVETELRQDGDQTVSANWKKDF